MRAAVTVIGYALGVAVGFGIDAFLLIALGFTLGRLVAQLGG